MFDGSGMFINLYIEEKRFVFLREKSTVILTLKKQRKC